MKQRAPAFFILTFCALPILAATDSDDPLVIPVRADARQDCGLPLNLFQSLKSKMDAAADPQALSALKEEAQAHQQEILAALSTSQSLQRQLAARVLPLMEDRKMALKRLSEVLAADDDADVRAVAAMALGVLNDATAVGALIAGLSDPAGDVRSQCAQALGLLRDERAVPALERMIEKDSEVELRICAVQTLARIHTGLNEKNLTMLMEKEGDERVRMALAALIRVASGGETIIAGVPEKDDFCKRLSDVAGEMKDVEGRLRDDRHDQAVQWDQKEIERKLRAMTDEMEKMHSIEVQSKSRDSRNKNSRLAAALSGGKSGPRPGAQPASTPARSGEASLNAANVAGNLQAWAQLPNKQRDELLQIMRPEVPLRWRKRLEAYFVSIAAEEVKTAK